MKDSKLERAEMRKIKQDIIRRDAYSEYGRDENKKRLYQYVKITNPIVLGMQIAIGMFIVFPLFIILILIILGLLGISIF